MKKFLRKVFAGTVAVMLTIPVSLLIGFAGAAKVQAASTVIAGWSFPSQSNGLSDSGIPVNLNRQISSDGTGPITYTSASPNPTYAARAASWNLGEDWKINLSTTGYSSLLLSSKQRSSVHGPRDFKVQYSLDDLFWADVASTSVQTADDYTTGVLNNISLPTDCDNHSSVYLRFVVTSSIAADGGAITSAGASNIDDISITGRAILDQIPTVASSSITSDNANHSYGKIGDTVSLRFQTSSLVLVPSVKMNGQFVTLLSAPNNNFTATHVLNSFDTEGPISFTIDYTDTYGNQAPTVTTTTDSSSVTFDKTSPVGLKTDKYSVSSYLGDNGQKLLNIKGTTEANATVKFDIEANPIQPGVSLVKSAQADINGNFELIGVELSAIVSSKYDINPAVIDAAGNQSAIGDSEKLSAVYYAKDDAPEFLDPNDAVSFDFSKDYTSPVYDLQSPIDSSVKISGGIYVRKDTGDGIFEMTIQPNTVMIAGNPNFGFPDLVNPVVKPAQSGTTIGLGKYIEIGNSAASFTFNNPVKLVFRGKVASLVGFVKDGKFTPITQDCGSDPSDMTFSATGECRTTQNSGADLVVWTKHFTQFATYTQKVNAPVISSVTNVQKDGKNYIDLAWASTGADSYEIYVDNILATPSVLTTGSAEIPVSSIGQHAVKIRAKVGSVFSDFSIAVNVTVSAIASRISTPAVPSLVASASAAAVTPAAPTTQSVVSTPSDSQGIIKGTDAGSTPSESTNWTPWIILFTLIILAGAVTGGYFYWFAGKEETVPLVKKKEETKPIAKPVIPKKEEAKKKPTKKPNRW